MRSGCRPFGLEPSKATPWSVKSPFHSPFSKGGYRGIPTTLYYLLPLLFFLLLLSCGYRLPDRPSSGSVERVVLAELFTAVYCPTCPEAIKHLSKLCDTLSASMVLVAFHPTSNDPFGSEKTDARRNLYTVPGFPTLVIDGGEPLVGVQSYETYQNKVLDRLSLKSPIRITLQDSVTASQVTGTAKVIVVDSVSGNFLFNLVVYEDSLHYYAINGETLHRFVVRDIQPEIALALNPKDSIIQNFTFSINPNWQIEKMGYVVFLSNPTTKEVIQCAHRNLRTPPFNFTLTVPETLKTTPLNRLAQFSFEMKNTGSQADSLVIDIPDSLNLPLGWGVSLCDSFQCHSRPYTIYCAPGQTISGLKVSIGPTTRDTGSVTLKVSSQNNPALVREQKLYVQTE